MRSIFKDQRSSSTSMSRRSTRDFQNDDASAYSNRRRQQLSFLNYGSQMSTTSRRTESSIRKTREHARQIALKMSQNRELQSPTESHSKIAAFADFSSAFGQQQQQQPSQSAWPSQQQTHGTSLHSSEVSSEASSFFDQDPFAAGNMPSHMQQPQQQPPPQQTLRSNKSSVSSSSSSRRRNRTQHQQQQQSQQQYASSEVSSSFVADWPTDSPSAVQQPPPRSSNNSGVVTIKQNSDGSYHRQTPSSSSAMKERMGVPLPGMTSSTTQPASAAARRRVRTQMRSSNSERSVGSVSSHTSNASSAKQAWPQDNSNNSGSTISNSSRLSKHVQRGKMRQQMIASSGRSVGSARSVASSASSANGTMDFLDRGAGSNTNRPGFTFDAFGLDASQMDQQVDQAMHDLAGTHPEFDNVSLFSDPPPEDALKRAPQKNHQQQQQWANEAATSPTPSRSSTPSVVEEEGFVDGFRVTAAQKSQHHKQMISPSGSLVTDRSSDNSSMGSRNKQQLRQPNNLSVTTMQPNTSATRTSRVALQHQQYQQPLHSNRSKENIQFVDDQEQDGAIFEANFDQPMYPPTSDNTGRAKSDVGLSPSAMMGIRGMQHSHRGASSDAGFMNSDAGVASDVGVNVPSDAGVNSDFEASHLRRDFFPQEDSIPLQVFHKEKHQSPSSTKSLRKTTKGSEDTATTASTGYSQHTSYEEKKEQEEALEAQRQWEEEQNEKSPSRWTSDHHESAQHLSQQHLDSLHSNYDHGMVAPDMQEQYDHPQSNPYAASSRYAKSEGAAVRVDLVNTAMNNLQLQSTSPKQNAYSDNGVNDSSPEFLRIKLKSTGRSFEELEQKNSNDGQNHGQLVEYGDPEPQHFQEDEPTFHSPQKTMTYRERRELELQQEQQKEQERLQQEQQQQMEKPHQLTYRERREMELREQQQQSEQQQYEREQMELDHQRQHEQYDYEQSQHHMHQHDHVQRESEFGSTEHYDAPIGESRPQMSRISEPPPTVATMFEQPPSPPLKMTQQPPSQQDDEEELDPRAAMMKALTLRGAPPTHEEETEEVLNPRAAMMKALQSRGAPPPVEHVNSNLSGDDPVVKTTTPKATKVMLNAFLSNRGDGPPVIKKEQPPEPTGRPALKHDPEFERYFKMLKLGMPIEVVKHALERDGHDPAIMDGDPNKPACVGIPLCQDPEYEKYFKMLKVGMPMDAVKHAMERDGKDSSVMDQDHNLPARAAKKKTAEETQEEKDSHRRARLHWKTLRKVTSNSLWAQLDQDDALGDIDIDEDEFQELFQVEKGEEKVKTKSSVVKNERTAVRVIDAKRANNGGIILARLKMSHDDMADAVDKIDENALSAEQIENIIEYLPSKEERKALEAYMLAGGQDAAEKFDGLCECEKFMVSMMTVKHAKQKVRALLFKLQFEQCLDDILQDTLLVEGACDELINSTRLRQLLGIVLTFGNRLNTAGNRKRKAGAFTLDSLLKLSQAKAFDKKTTFLHYLILIVQRNNENLLSFKDDLPTIFKADKVFWDQCLTDLDEVESQLENVRRIALNQARNAHGYQLRRTKKKDDDDDSLSDGEIELSLEEEVEALRATPIGMFTLSAIKYVSSLRDKVEDTRGKFSHLLEYFGEEEETVQPHELFSIVAKFCRDFDKAREEVAAKEKKKQREERKRQNKVPLEGRPPVHNTPDKRQSQQQHAPPHSQQQRPPQQQQRPTGMLRASSLQPSISGVMKQSRLSQAPAPQAPPMERSSSHAMQSQHVNDSSIPLADNSHDEPNKRTEHAHANPTSGQAPRSPVRDLSQSANPAPKSPGTRYGQSPSRAQSSNQNLARFAQSPATKTPNQSQFVPPRTPDKSPKIVRTPVKSNQTQLNMQSQGMSFHPSPQQQVPVQPSPSIDSNPEQTAATNMRGNAAIASLRQKARMKKMIQQHRSPLAHSNSSPPAMQASPNKQMQQSQQPSISSPKSPSRSYQRSQSAGVDDVGSPKNSPVMSPRSSFRQRRRMEVRERMRQEKNG